MAKTLDILRIAYIILVHKNPEQLARLVSRLNTPYCYFFIHVDIKESLEIYRSEAHLIASGRLHFLKQYDGAWGKFGILQAEVTALKEIESTKVPYDFVLLLSGQDYPIKNNQFIFNYLSAHRGKSFLNFSSMPVPGWNDGGMYRINRYHFTLWGKSYAYPPYKAPKSLRHKVFNFFFQLYFGKRTMPYGLKPFLGEHWWCLSKESVTYILQFLLEHPVYYKFHRYSLCADEIFFHTILLNSRNPSIQKNMVNDHLRYIDWTDGKDSPSILTIKDLDYLMQSPKLFARKFDLEVDAAIMDRIDQKILLES